MIKIRLYGSGRPYRPRKAVRPSLIRILPIGIACVLLSAQAATAASWTLAPAPTVAGVLSGVSCPSATFCMAVGFAGGSSLAERSNGKDWSIVATPETVNGLGDVSCTSRTFCLAASSLRLEPSRAVLERWDGARWSILRTWPSASTLSVSCTSRRFCAAVVGKSAVQWNGKRWSKMTFAKPPLSALDDVSCSSSKFCEAVAATMQPTCFATCPTPNPWSYAWHGTSWSAQPSYSPDYSAGPTAVSCTSAKACMATGSAETGGDSPPYGFVGRWDGSAWATQRTPPFEGDSLNGVSCVANSCTAVGAQNGQFGDLPPTPLAEVWQHGDWSLEPTPVMPAAASETEGVFTSVACPTRAACTAVGTYVTPSGQNEVLIERHG